ncbi:hypothetical protein ACFW1A_04070 [Kitasatospora sp. NPDC058965]|uniref:hypothetical protein n=1 Tax=Kitasatospora sp. NPDC058965 TaxID=3346682 RepID=UPI0036B3101B
MPQPLRRTALLACGATALLGLTACSSGTAAAPAAAAPVSTPGSAAATTAPSPSAAPSAPALPTGTKLNSLLLPATALPAGFKLDPDGARSTGDGYNPSEAPSAVPSPQSCDLLNTSAWITASGVSPAAFAQNDYQDASQNMIAQELDAFRGDDAKAAMAALTKALTGCHTFTVTQNGQHYTATITVKPLPGLGDEALQATLTSPSFTGGTTMVATRTGSFLAATYDSSQTTTGAAAVTYAKTLAKALPPTP